LSAGIRPGPLSSPDSLAEIRGRLCSGEGGEAKEGKGWTRRNGRATRNKNPGYGPVGLIHFCIHSEVTWPIL